MTHSIVPLLWSLVVTFALAMYVLLDGMDLGVGMLLCATPKERYRDVMVTSIAPVWDANETWLVLVGVGLLGGLPAAYGVLLPAFYFPVFGMLFSLAFRGTAFEFRFQTIRYRTLFDAAFCAGSWGAAICQGLAVGGLLQGVTARDGQFSGSPLEVFTPFSFLVAATLISGYLLTGAAWLNMRAIEGSGLQKRSRAQARAAAAAFAVLFLIQIVASRSVDAIVAHFWRGTGIHGLMWTSVAAFVAACGLAVYFASSGRRRAAFLASLAAMALATLGVVGVLWPFVIPYSATIWDAASPQKSQIVLLVAAFVMLPFILSYNAYAYWVFRGRIVLEEGDYEALAEEGLPWTETTN